MEWCRFQLPTFSDPLPRFQGHGVTVDALDILCVQLTCDLFEISKFLVVFSTVFVADTFVAL